MGKWSDWLNSTDSNKGPGDGATPQFYEDTHKNGVYTGGGTITQSMQTATARQYQNVVVYNPKTPDDVQRLIDYLKRREPAIINLDDIDEGVAQRILDFCAGALYALSGSIHRISSNIFLLSPEGVEITVPFEI